MTYPVQTPRLFMYRSKAGWLMAILCLFMGSLHGQEIGSPKPDANIGPLRIGVALPFHAKGTKT
ncbi:MAG: hypothetical protein RIQ91_1189, partial [Bacteroidota bacterium]